MATKRYYYANSISGFLVQDTQNIIGVMTMESPHDVDTETRDSWIDEITILKNNIGCYAERGSEVAAKREHKFNAKIEASVEIFNLGAKYWMDVYKALDKEQLLPYGDLDFIKNISAYISSKRLPSDAQCRRLVKIINKAEDKGYIMP